MKLCFKVSDNTSRSTSVALVSRHGDTKARERAEVVVFNTPDKTMARKFARTTLCDESTEEGACESSFTNEVSL